MHAIIMAGGAGTRFWPASRRHRPKQLLTLWGEPMITRTARGLAPVIPYANQWIITAEHLAAPIEEAVPGIDAARVIAEPVGRNTAPCVGLAAMILEETAGDTIFGVFPADHVITDLAAWEQCLRDAYEEAESGAIVTLGILPTRPETGYGYICVASGEDTSAGTPCDVERFVEKPDLATAERYLASGRYLWNGGIFITRTSTMLAEIKRQMPELYAGLQELRAAWATPRWEEAFARIYPTLPAVSVDYGVMEGAEVVRVVPVDIGWSDVGHWGALEETIPADAAGNVCIGDVLAIDAQRNVLVDAEGSGKLLVALGVDDLVIVDTPDALLVCPRDRVQDVRKVVAHLSDAGREELF